ncbi:MAG: hypothetical protein AAFR05_00335 [Bacteroidota bacterium]
MFDPLAMRNYSIIQLTCCLLLWQMATSLVAQPESSKLTQVGVYQLHRQIPIEARYLTSDKLQQFYLVDEQDHLIKYNADGVEVFRYDNNQLGRLDRVDAANPFHLLLYYPDYATLISLDRTLSPTSTYLLNDLGILQTSAIGIASDNNLWVYDEIAFRLRKYNGQGRVIVESQDFGVLFTELIQPVSLLERNNLLYLHDPQVGVLIFDLFGQYVRTIALPGLERFQILDRHLVGQRHGEMIVCPLASGIAQPMILPFELRAGQQVRVEQNSVMVLDEEGVRVYRRLR